MHALPSTLYTAAFALFAFSAGVLARRTRPRARGCGFFTGFLVLQAAVFACELLMVHPAAPAKTLWLALRLDLSLLQAPALWLALRELVEKEPPSWSAVGWRDRAAMVLGCIGTLPLLMIVHGGVTYVNPAALPAWHTRWIHEGMLLCIAVFVLQAPRYLWRCRRLLAAQEGEVATRRIRWLHLPLLVVTSTWVLGIVRTLQCAFFATPPEVVLTFAVVEVGVTAAALCLLVRRAGASDVEAEVGSAITPAAVTLQELSEPVVLKTPDAREGTATVAPGAVAPSAPGAPRYAKSPPDDATRQRIRRKLDDALARSDVLCNSLLDLRTLSRGMQEKAHYVSQVINQDLDLSFYELVSRHRVLRAQQLLVASPEQTILEIALAVGFNSKSTFNAAFRRHTKKTPRQHRAEAGPGSEGRSSQVGSPDTRQE